MILSAFMGRQQTTPLGFSGFGKTEKILWTECSNGKAVYPPRG
jgi:hypothetical protein